MRTTLAIAALLLACGAQAADPLRNFKLGGQIDMQAASADNVTDFQAYGNPINLRTTPNRDRIGAAQTRVLLHMDWDLLDDVHSRVTLRKSNRVYGQNSNASEDLNAVQTNVLVDQALFKIDKLFDAVDLTLGRQFFGAAGDMVLFYGPSDKARYGLPTTAVDGGRFDWSNDEFGFTGLVAKTAGTAIGTVPQPDTDVHGAHLVWKGNENANGGAYVWRQVAHRTGAAEGVGATASGAGGLNDMLYVAGLKGKLIVGAANLAAEVARNFGNNRAQGTLQGPASRTYKGWAAKANASYNAELRGIGVLAPWLHGGYGSGDGAPNDNKDQSFQAIAPDYRPGAIYGRFAGGTGLGNTALGAGLPVTPGPLGGPVSSASLSNRRIAGAGVRLTPESLERLTVALSAWDFWFAAASNPRHGGGNKHIGSEGDLDLTWEHNANVTLSLGAARFSPGGYIRETVQSQNIALGASARSGRGLSHAHLGYFDVRVKF